MDAYNKVFDCGVRLRGAMIESEVGKLTDRIFPVSTQVTTKLPFITFFRSGIEEVQVKSCRGPRTAYFQIQIYANDWSEGAAIASAVDECLDGYNDDGIRSCTLIDASENYDPTVPAYMQIMTYKVKTF